MTGYRNGDARCVPPLAPCANRLDGRRNARECLEPMTAPTNARAGATCPLATPGRSLTATFSIQVA